MKEAHHYYAPRGSALDAMRSKAPELVLSGPAGTGKSRACLEKVHAMALANPGMRAAILRKTAVSLTSSGLVTWEKQVIPESLDAGVVSFYGGSPREAAQYRYSNGSVAVVGGMDKPTKIMSTEYDLIYVQEAIELSLNDWESATSRLRHGKVSFQQMIGDTNPDRDTHWLNQRQKDGGCLFIESRHIDNPLLFDDEGSITEFGQSYMDRLDRLTGLRRMRLKDGLWVSAEGMIYGDVWDPAIHLVNKFFVPRDWPRWITVDFGYVHPFVAQWWAEDPDGRLYLYREIHMTQRLVEDHAKLMKKWIEIDKVPPREIICDHDAEGRATLEKYLGRKTIPARKNVTEGIQAVASRMKPAGDGKPRLIIMRDAILERDEAARAENKPLCTEEEIPGYVWTDHKTKEEPVKEEDDGCDAMRYMVARKDMGGSYRIRTLG